MATRLQEQIIRFKAAMEFTALKHMEVQSMNYISLLNFERAQKELAMERSFLVGRLWEIREEIGTDRARLDPETQTTMREAEQLLQNRA